MRVTIQFLAPPEEYFWGAIPNRKMLGHHCWPSYIRAVPVLKWSPNKKTFISKKDHVQNCISPMHSHCSCCLWCAQFRPPTKSYSPTPSIRSRKPAEQPVRRTFRWCISSPNRLSKKPENSVFFKTESKCAPTTYARKLETILAGIKLFA